MTTKQAALKLSRALKLYDIAARIQGERYLSALDCLEEVPSTNDVRKLTTLVQALRAEVEKERAQYIRNRELKGK